MLDIALWKCIMLPTSHDVEAVLSHGCGASLLCGSIRVLALHARGAEVAVVVGVALGAVAVVMCVAVGTVAVVMGVAVGVVAGVARSAGWGLWWGLLCVVESSLAPRAVS